MQKWEYCVVGPIKANVDGWRGMWPKRTNFLDTGMKVKTIKVEVGLEEHESLAKIISQMGKEGWEMVGCGNVEAYHLIYFKRPLEEQNP
jgi:hypothetical protein